MAEQRVIVEGDLGVESEKLVVLGRNERIDLDERSVGINECLIQILKESDRSIDLRGFEAERKGELARLPCAEAHGRVDGFFEDGLGSLCGNFFNLHAAGLRGHEDQSCL